MTYERDYFRDRALSTHLTKLEILQRFRKTVILSILAMTSHVHQNWYYELVRKFDVYLHAKN